MIFWKYNLYKYFSLFNRDTGMDGQTSGQSIEGKEQSVVTGKEDN